VLVAKKREEWLNQLAKGKDLMELYRNQGKVMAIDSLLFEIDIIKEYINSKRTRSD
jgi:hypothetical protein